MNCLRILDRGKVLQFNIAELVRSLALQCRGLLHDKTAAILPEGGAGGRGARGVVPHCFCPR
jgi:hypothetical protein